jgi:hypothetical protein
MGMRELLRVAMSEKQVKEACEQWARSRTNTGNGTAAQMLLDIAADGVVTAEVIFLKKRERKPRANGAPQAAEPDTPF